MSYTFYGLVISWLAMFLLVFWCAMWIVHLTAIIYAKMRLHKKIDTDVENHANFGGVSILKPLKGMNSNLVNNLETYFTLQYPQYEIIFCIEEPTDPAINVVNALIEKYPNIDVQVVIGGSSVGVNPKINNMNPGYGKAKYDFVLISDSSIKMKQESLLDMMNFMEEDTGIVHQMPFTCDRDSFTATLEKVYFGTAHARIYLFADYMQVNCHTGMSTLIRKPLLDDVGGIQAFGCYLAEDFFMAKSVMERGWRTRICSQPALQNTSYTSVHAFHERLRRWTKLRTAMVPHTVILEPLSECLILGALTSWAMYVLFRFDPVMFYLVHILVWFLFDWTLLRIIQNSALPFSKFYFIIAWLYREVSGPYVFLSSLKNPIIKWHSRVYKVNPGGIAEEISAKNKI